MLYDIEGEVIFNNELEEERTRSFVMRLLYRSIYKEWLSLLKSCLLICHSLLLFLRMWYVWMLLLVVRLVVVGSGQRTIDDLFKETARLYTANRHYIMLFLDYMSTI